MKIIRNGIILVVLCWLVFVYRVELTAFVDGLGMSGGSTVARADWGGLREAAQQAAESGDPAAAIGPLQEYLSALEDELNGHENGRRGMVTVPGDLFCELSLIHHNLADAFYRLGDEDGYYRHLKLYREFLARCSEYKEYGRGG